MNASAAAPPEPRHGQHPDVLFAEIEESEAVLLSLRAGRYYRLNESGSLIWQALYGGATPADIARALEGRYEVTHDDAIAHAHAFVAELLREGLVHGDAPGPAE